MSNGKAEIVIVYCDPVPVAAARGLARPGAAVDLHRRSRPGRAGAWHRRGVFASPATVSRSGSARSMPASRKPRNSSGGYATVSTRSVRWATTIA